MPIWAAAFVVYVKLACPPHKILKTHLYYVCGSKTGEFTTRPKICDQKKVRCERLDALAWESVKGLFADLDRLRDDLRAAQQAELTAQDPKRDELKAVEDFIAQADRKADEIALAMRQAKGRVGESLQKQQDDLNARLDGYHKRRGELIAELGARRLTDDAIQDIMEFARDVRTGIEEADFETKQRIFELLDVKVKVDDDKAQVSCVIADSISCYTCAPKFLSESQTQCANSYSFSSPSVPLPVFPPAPARRRMYPPRR